MLTARAMSAPLLGGAFAFGVTTVLYHGTEELLVEAHKVQDIHTAGCCVLPGIQPAIHLVYVYLAMLSKQSTASLGTALRRFLGKMLISIEGAYGDQYQAAEKLHALAD